MTSPAKPRADLILIGATEIVTCVPASGDPIGRIRDGAIAIAGDHILAVGRTTEVMAQVDTGSAERVDASSKILAPGFVDCHTHLVFGGSRVQEYAARLTRDLADVQALGIPTGIIATVGMTRAESAAQLSMSAAQRLQRMFRSGTTTVESKSGYGLTIADELKLLEVNRALQAIQPVDIVSTFLGAHAFPREHSHGRYVDMVVHEMIPQVAERALAEFCDVFCDDGYFSANESRRILEAGRAAGLKPKIHADQYAAIEGSAVAAQAGVVSADHLNYTTRADMQRLAEAGVVGVVTPALDFAVRHPRPFDARAMLAEGLTLALATDLCPACWVESMQLVMTLACRLYRLSPEEALYAATVGGAKALGLDDRGRLAPGQLADIQVWDLPSFEDVVYRIGNNAVVAVVKRGKLHPFNV
ncbi:MAG: imidazolonepropionase [Chloroflexi bacterium]|nr:imidazolonepropionase [Chloroflexota bacterium]